MKKIIAYLLFVFGLATFIARSANFYGHQSLNGLQSFKIFTAPYPGYFYVNGKLTLPQPSANGNTGQSQVVATIGRTGVGVIYTGAAGANGFQLTQIPLVTGDEVYVILSSTAPVDQVTNAVRGEVYFGNSF